MAQYVLDTDLIAQLIFKPLPHKHPCILTMDRTNWKLGETNINILVIAISSQGLAFPLIFTLMPKRGDSSTAEKIAIVERYIQLLKNQSPNYLLKGSLLESNGGYLNRNRISYYLRIRNNFLAFDPRKQKELKVSWLFTDIELGKTKFLPKIYYINKQLCYLAGSKIKNKEGKEELQIIVSFHKPEKSIENYKQRWQIESAFRALKSSGFNIEDTHLTNLERMDKLLSIGLLTSIWAYKTEIYLHQNIKQIRILKHKNKAKSLFKYGLEYIAWTLLNPYRKNEIDIAKFLSCT